MTEKPGFSGFGNETPLHGLGSWVQTKGAGEWISMTLLTVSIFVPQEL